MKKNIDHILTYVDKTNRFWEIFNKSNGSYVRSGVIDDNGIDTDIDPFMRDFPQLLDLGILGACLSTKECRASGIECYQGNDNKPNMSLEDYKNIIDQCKGKVFQVALGGRGNPDDHENFEEIMEYSYINDVIPNYTTSGINLTKEKALITKKFGGAVAVSYQRAPHTFKAIDTFLSVGMKTNIHYVLGNHTIDEAIDKLKNNDFPKGINAIVFLLHKPVGLGTQKNVLNPDDPKVKEFFKIIDSFKFDFKIGFDACSIPGIVNFSNNINKITTDTCEGGRYSAYINSESIMVPCSFDNQSLQYGLSLKEYSIKEVWNSDKFDEFRNYLKYSCKSCVDRTECRGGCPLQNSIVLCNRKERCFSNQ